MERTLPRSACTASPAEQVERLARLARECRGRRHRLLRARSRRGPQRWPDGFFVVPGVRPAGGDVGDQKRVVTPRAGAGRRRLDPGHRPADHRRAPIPAQAIARRSRRPCEPCRTKRGFEHELARAESASGIPFLPKRQTAENLWHKCGKCGTMVFVKEWEENYSVCPRCDFHDRIGPQALRAVVRRRAI